MMYTLSIVACEITTNKEQKRRNPWYNCSSSQQHIPQQADANDDMEPQNPVNIVKLFTFLPVIESEFN